MHHSQVHLKETKNNKNKNNTIPESTCSLLILENPARSREQENDPCDGDGVSGPDAGMSDTESTSQHGPHRLRRQGRRLDEAEPLDVVGQRFQAPQHAADDEDEDQQAV